MFDEVSGKVPDKRKHNIEETIIKSLEASFTSSDNPIPSSYQRNCNSTVSAWLRFLPTSNGSETKDYELMISVDYYMPS